MPGRQREFDAIGKDCVGEIMIQALRDNGLDANPNRQADSSAVHLWAVLLAGGDGVRLRELTRRIAGDSRRKQFCRIIGEQSLFRETRTRLDPIFIRDRRVFVFSRTDGIAALEPDAPYAASKPLIGAVTATAADVVLTGELNGDLVALDGKSGKVLFRGDLGGPIAGGVATYVARNVQHIAVVSGYVG